MFDTAARRRGMGSGARFATIGMSLVAHVVLLAGAAAAAVAFAYDRVPMSPPRQQVMYVRPQAPPPLPPPPAATTPRAVKQPPKVVRTPPVTPSVPVSVASPGPAHGSPIASGPPEVDIYDLDGVEGGVPGGLPGGLLGRIAPGADVIAPPPPPPALAKPVRVGGRIDRPRLLHRVDPEYPTIAERARIGGVVILEATVGTDGCVNDVRVLRAHPLLADSAIHAVSQWAYEPLTLNGTPHPFVLTVTLTYALN